MVELRTPWLVAAWPGMGAVAQLAASYLAQNLNARLATELAVGEHFGPSGVQVRQGVLQPIRRPRTLLLEARPATAPRDLAILMAEGQPTVGERRYCEQLLVKARELGVERVFTFAALATASPPQAPSRVFAAATDATLLAALCGLGAEALTEGEIGGMNGYFLAVAAELGLPGACLLGEIPFFASNVPNPKASAAVLRLFARHSGATLDLTALERQGQEVERQLLALQSQVEESLRHAHEHDQEHEHEAATPAEAQAQARSQWPRLEREGTLGVHDRELIESLFREAVQDRSKALTLKAELDRLGVFARYEDRFLDLFKRAG